MTEDEHIELVEVGNYFYDEFSKLIATCLQKLPKNIEAEALDYLSDMSSVFGSDYDKYMSTK